MHAGMIEREAVSAASFGSFYQGASVMGTGQSDSTAIALKTTSLPLDKTLWIVRNPFLWKPHGFSALSPFQLLKGFDSEPNFFDCLVCYAHER